LSEENRRGLTARVLKQGLGVLVCELLFYSRVVHKLRMKKSAYLVLLAVSPYFSGCLSMNAIHAADRHIVVTALHDSVDRIEKAGVTKDDRLCIFFEKELTNATQSRFMLVIPLAQIRTNAQEQTGFSTAGRIITSAIMHVPGSMIRTNWTLSEHAESDLKLIPVGEPLIIGGVDRAIYHSLKLTLLSNATETIYLTRTTPIEFTYLDTSINRTLTTVTIDPMLISRKRTEHPGNYFLLPLTVPIDIATLPIQAIGVGLFLWMFSGPGNC
jgi:hypothetical protein